MGETWIKSREVNLLVPLVKLKQDKGSPIGQGQPSSQDAALDLGDMRSIPCSTRHLAWLLQMHLAFQHCSSHLYGRENNTLLPCSLNALKILRSSYSMVGRSRSLPELDIIITITSLTSTKEINFLISCFMCPTSQKCGLRLTLKGKKAFVFLRTCK